jgi:hypothetical protein
VKGARNGSILLAALVGLLLLEAAIAGLLYVCTQEALASGVHTQRLRARLAAQSAVDQVMARWPADSVRALPPGGIHRPQAGRGSVAGASFEVEVERLSGTAFHVRGHGRTRAAGPPAAHAAGFVSMLETAAIWRDFSAPVSAAGDLAIGPRALLDATRPDVPAPGSGPSGCPAAMAEFTSLLGSAGRPALIAAPSATVTVDPLSVIQANGALVRDSAIGLASFDGAGPLDVSLVPVLADRTETGTLTLAAVSSGTTCDTAAAANWGDPDDPSSPCGRYFPLIYAPGDLEIAGGAGQGVLIVAGHLRIAAGVRFTGAISAAGGITAEAATITGALRSGPAPSRIDAAVSFNLCALERAFTGTPAFRQPYRRGNRWWLPAF